MMERKYGLTFDGKNGRPYASHHRTSSSVGISQPRMPISKGWFRGSARIRMRQLCHENKSYIFFKEMGPAEPGPQGSLGAQLSTGRSLAADPHHHMLEYLYGFLRLN